ncbi:hypothetical protein [Peristeroidobacter agariperforans]|uniref:hypothetical protein n=1 Tax=Peristeroidobacter agariperforans TaxID=268404 RepID=UPI00101BB7C4|nr:hypothetical protein [Peristeroidobacter agariperforans]
MSNRTGGLMGIVAITLSMLTGCASNVTQVRTRSALDLGCDASDIDVQLIERRYVGVTRYEATGCGITRPYECRARFYFLGLPMGERTCKRPGSPGPVGSPRGVSF